MQSMHMKTTALALTLAVVLVSPLFADVIYREDFDGDATSLNGKVPTVRPSGSTEVWIASNAFLRNGTVTGSVYNGAYLAFAPESGNIYKLTAALSVPYVAGQDSNMLVGFAATTNTGAGIGTAQGYAMGELEANSATTHSVNALTGVGTAGESPLASSVTLAGSGVVTYEITLDATDASAANWTAAWSVTDGSTVWSQGPTTAASGSYGNIKSLALFTRQGQGTFDYVQLEIVPEPATMALLGLGGAALLRRRRK